MKKKLKNVLIIGGNIGLQLAKMLEENFEDVRVKIIENKQRAEEIANELSSSIVINGDALDKKY